MGGRTQHGKKIYIVFRGIYIFIETYKRIQMKLKVLQKIIEYITSFLLELQIQGKVKGTNGTLNSFNGFRVKPDILWPPQKLHVWVKTEIFNLIVMLELPILHI